MLKVKRRNSSSQRDPHHSPRHNGLPSIRGTNTTSGRRITTGIIIDSKRIGRIYEISDWRSYVQSTQHRSQISPRTAYIPETYYCSSKNAFALPLIRISMIYSRVMIIYRKLQRLKTWKNGHACGNKLYVTSKRLGRKQTHLPNAHIISLLRRSMNLLQINFGFEIGTYRPKPHLTNFRTNS